MTQHAAKILLDLSRTVTSKEPVKSLLSHSTGAFGKDLLIPFQAKPSSYPITCPYRANNIILLCQWLTLMVCGPAFYTITCKIFFCNPQLSQYIFTKLESSLCGLLSYFTQKMSESLLTSTVKDSHSCFTVTQTSAMNLENVASYHFAAREES